MPAYDTAFPRLLAPIQLGPKRAPNRVMRLATVANLGERGGVGDRMLAHYAAAARGGAGAIVTEALRVHASDRGRDGAVVLYERHAIPGFRRLAEAVHGEGALLIAQLHHGGRQHFSRRVPTLWAPSPIACPRSGGVPHEMTPAEIEDVIRGFVASALHAREAGLDGVEIHGAQGHLIGQFVSPFSNQRTDEWGGSFENRLRFPRRIIQAVRDRAGRDVIVGYRLGVEEFTPGGVTLEDSQRVARELAREGLIDYLSLSQGNFNTLETHLPDRHFPLMTYLDLHAAIKAAAGALPVVACTRVQTPAQAEAILAAGKADMVGLCRALIADPDWVAKARSGRGEDIRLCIACNHCWGVIVEGEPIACTVNPLAGREHELGPLVPARAPRRIIVAGGGPAGLEAARVAAERGHHVTVFEQTERLGGKVRIAEEVPHHEEMGHAIQFLIRQVERLGVTVRTGAEATADLIAAERPDAVVVATGATPLAPEVPGDDSVPVSTSAGVVLAGLMPGDNIVIMDEDAFSWAAAVIETAAQQGKKVTVVTRFFEALKELPAVSRIATLRALDQQGVALRPNTFVDRMDNGDVVLKHYYSGREERIPKVAALIWVGPQKANDELAAELRARGITDVHIVGDALAPRRLTNAIAEGHRAGRAV
ncbi:MAG: FAD-dependent oxidoreductase [Candidatus Rokubacteria bacterium]|nr:FAD-dependent oxidoreductase [Candidatus Rokubacteria bacterium]